VIGKSRWRYCCRRGPELIAAILGALAAGKIYVPLDPAHSPARNRDALADCSPALLLGRPGEPRAARDLLTGDRLLDLAAIDERAPSEDPNLDLAPDRLAYIYYTSGSTGRPKGVADCHRNVLHNILRYTDSLMIGCEDRLTLLQSCAYSGAVSSLFAALFNGASSHVIDLPAEGVQGLARRIEAERITMFHGVPAIFRALVATDVDLSSLRVVRLEGDLAGRRDAELFQRRFGRGCALVNGLGATETGLTCQYFLAPDRPLAAGGLPVGYPIADVEIAILGEDGSEAAPGVIGEVEVRSRYLAVGYWGDPARTAERFGGDCGGVRCYWSGDLGRRRSDGALELLGRKDLLVKLNGAWVDLGAVEQALLELPGVRDAAVVVREAEGGRTELVAYLVPAGMPPPDPSEWRAGFARRAPQLPAPTRWEWLPALPPDANGKIDRAKLPAPADRLATTDADASDAVGVCWQEILGAGAIRRDQPFGEAGGDSFAAIELALLLERRLQAPVPPDLIDALTTLDQLVLRLGQGRGTGCVTLLAEGGAGTPLVLFHGVYGHLVAYTNRPRYRLFLPMFGW
jgi:amino acid adenylation domain-containing protein